jgi:relaxase-like protein
MIPNISRNGHSFIDAGAYHLHDKPTDSVTQPRTADRLLFTATRNLANSDPHRALLEMLRTARDAAQLKAMHGIGPGGRKNDAPVKTISLAWKPGQAPDRAQMIAAADDFLLTMGWQQHQAVYAAHSDTAHSHIHIILNRVNPANGKTLNDWQERKRAQNWALAFERVTGPVLCEARMKKYEQRQRTTPASLPHPDAQILRVQAHAERHLIRQAIRCQFRGQWAQYYRDRQSAVRLQKQLTERTHRTAMSLAREGAHDAALHALAANDDRRQNINRTFARRRQMIIRARRAVLRASLPKPSVAGQRTERKQLLAQQAAACAALRSPANTKASALARADVALAFANRWAEIRKLPAELREAATDALMAEQAAMMEARLMDHGTRLAQLRRAGSQQLAQIHRMQRRTLAHRHREAWQFAAHSAAVRQAMAPVPAPPQERGGQCAHSRSKHG